MTKLNLLVDQAGIYTLTTGDLRNAGLGDLSLSQTGLRLSLREVDQPFLVEGSGDTTRLIFLGQPSSSRYTRSNVYSLEWDNPASEIAQSAPSSPLSETPELGITPLDIAKAVVHLEENNIYNPQAVIDDHWLWQTILGGSQFETNFHLPVWVEGPSTVKVSLWSNTQADPNPDHHAILLINENEILDISWDGRGSKVFDISIPAGILVDGENLLTLKVPGDTGAPAELIHLDSIEITYTRRLLAQNGRLSIWGSGASAQPEDFIGRVLVASQSPESPKPELYWLEAGSPLLTQPDVQYWLAEPEALLSPALDVPVTSPDLRASTLGADYLAVGPQDLLDALKPLLDLRQSQGLQTMTIPLEAVFDQFGAGFPEPDAITAFLKYTRSWQIVPQFVLLVGDASYDPLGIIAEPEINRLPTFFVNTRFGGETASDIGYSLLDQDLLPDIALGRLPASSPEQVSLYVKKVLVHEAIQPESPRQVLSVIDGSEGSFQADAQDFMGQLDLSVQTRLLSALPGDSAMPVNLVQAFQDGQSMIAYFGHGSVTLWGKEKIFDAAAAAALANQRYPVVMTMTCLNGLFTHPTTTSLAESLLWSPQGGAVAVLAPSSLTLAEDQASLRRPFIDAIFNQGLTLGQALLAAQRIVIEQYPSSEAVTTFFLFGDPALKLK